MRDDTERLRDILEAIERVEKYARLGKTVFEQQELIQTWIVYHLQIIGEAARLFWFSCVNFCYELKQANSLSRRCSK
ncbi:nucleotidyltransferase, partial [Microcystis aeruginosa CS-555/01A07]|uniref:HepT-like ribonuclease domain-containing protein n=1 Tax=Microcystis aeruginosa TaxID=1126 RepID=UPI002FEE4514|nr:nucleotidyltransferase [Microcystis aeruginosa CS-555/01A07]